MIMYQEVSGFLVPTYTDETQRGPDGEKLLTKEQAAKKFGVELHVIDDVTMAFRDGNRVDYRLYEPPEPLTTENELQLLRGTKYEHLSSEHFDLLRAECSHLGISLWGNLVSGRPKWIPGKRRPELQINIANAARRSLAETAGLYGGQLGPWWAGPDREWKDSWPSKDYPAVAKVGVKRKGIDEPYWGIAHWNSFVPYIEDKNGDMLVHYKWDQAPPERLAMVAEREALKRAFPGKLEKIKVQRSGSLAIAR